jgi:DNA-binding transcriptional LysR family regulator
VSVHKSSDSLDWDGLRYFQALAQAGTLSEAARKLRVQHSTVARRIDGLEASLGARLFLRNARGYTLTRVGQTVLESVQGVSVQVEQVARLAEGQDVQMAGTVRVATADALAKSLVLPAVQRLLREQHGLTVELVSDTRQHDLARREADLALRIGASADTLLVGRRLAALGFGLYGSARQRPQRTTKLALERASYVMFDEAVGKLPHEAWLAEHAPEARVVLRANRQETLIEAVRLGVGLGILPCLVADADPSLHRVLGPDRVFSRDLWLLAHPDVQGSRRVRAVFDALAEHVSRHAARVVGLGASP